MANFEDRIKEAAEKTALKFISAGNWMQPDYQKQMAARIEKELADKIVNRMAAEISNDVKSILFDEKRRAALRRIAIEHLDEICNPSEATEGES